MNNREITSIALKVFAIYILIQGLVSMPSLLRGFVYYSELEVANHLDTYALAWAISIPSVLAIFVLSFVIWKMSNNIGLKLSEKKAQSEYTVTQEFLLGLLGIYLLTEALVNLTFMLSDHYFTGLKPEYFSDKVEAYAYIVANAVQLLISFSLMFQASSWTSFVRRFREIGVYK